MQCFGVILTGLKEAKVSASYPGGGKRRKENIRHPLESYVKLEFPYKLIRKTNWLILAQHKAKTSIYVGARRPLGALEQHQLTWGVSGCVYRR